jgi:hypothetical protein
MRLAQLAFMLVFTGLFVGCVPGAFGGDPWALAIFAPSTASESRACDAGYEYGQTQKSFNSVGSIRFNSTRGPVMLSTRLGKLYFLCNTLGVVNGRKPTQLSPVFSTNILLEDATLVGKRVRVLISLEDDQGKEIGQLNASARETENNRQWYSVPAFTDEDLKRLGEAKSFSILINRGDQPIERYKVTQSFTPLSPTSIATLEMNKLSSPETRRAFDKGLQ